MELSNNSQKQEIEIDLRNIIMILWEKAVLLVMISILFGAAAFVLTKALLVPQYSSTTRLYVLSNSDDGTTTLTDLQVSTQLTKDFQILVTSAPVMEQVISDLKLDILPEKLAEKVTVSTPTDTRILVISVEYDDPDMAKKIVDDIAAVASERICAIMKIEQVNVVEEGKVSDKPVSSGAARNAVIGAMIGFVLASAIVLVRSLLDDSIKATEDLEKYLGLSTLSVIPFCEEMDDGRVKSRKNKKAVKKAAKASRKADKKAVNK